MQAKQRLRDMRLFAAPASSLSAAAVAPEVQEALRDWAANHFDCVLIGGLAMSFYGVPRYTVDVDVLFQSVLPMSADGFKRLREHAFMHRSTHVEVEALTHAFLNIPEAVVTRVFTTAVPHDGILVASRDGMVALKLYAALHTKRELKDKADLQTLLQVPVDMAGWQLPEGSEQVIDDLTRRNQ